MTNPYFWPNTKIVKSLDNDFNWREQVGSQFTKELAMFIRQSKAGALGGQVTRKLDTAKQAAFYITPTEKPYQKAFTTYSKAVPSRKSK